MADPLMDAWVERVLGIAPAPIVPAGLSGLLDDEGGPPRGLGAVLADWQDALDVVDAEIAELQRALRRTSDEELHAIADFGLNALTGNHKVRLQAAVLDLRAAASGKAVQAALAQADAFLQHIETDEKIAACDANPFGVRVAIRAALAPTLRAIQRELGAPADG